MDITAKMVKELRDDGMTVLYTTHYMEEAEELSDRVGIIDKGELVAIGLAVRFTTIGRIRGGVSTSTGPIPIS